MEERVRRLIVATLVCLANWPALADCTREALAARERLSNSGPFHFESTYWEENVTSRICGAMEPGRAEHRYVCEPTESVHEEITIGDQNWENDGSGWVGAYELFQRPGSSQEKRIWTTVPGNKRLLELFGGSKPAFHFRSCPLPDPIRETWTPQHPQDSSKQQIFEPTFQMRLPCGSSAVVEARCLGRISHEGRDLITYEFATQDTWASSLPSGWHAETLFVDPDSGLPVRLETREERARGVRSVTTYRFDASIRIDPPPVVDPWQASLAHFAQEAERADPACRAEFFAAVQRGGRSAFRYETHRPTYYGASSTIGTFVPPNAVHSRALGYGSDHGAGTEIVALGAKTWIRGRPSRDRVTEWREETGRASGHGMIEALNPSAGSVGYVECVGRISHDGRDYRAYRYDFYWNVVGDWQLEWTDHLLVDPSTTLPAGKVRRTDDGTWEWVEKRTYDPSLTVEAPTIARAPPEQ
jgi:hypothetical protein